MKTISLIFLTFFFISLGCSESDDLQSNFNDELQLKSVENGNYTEQFYLHPMGGEEYYLPVICDGVEVDVLVGDGVGLTVHVLIHYKDGVMQWGKWIVQGQLTSESTTETFTIHEVNKGQFDENGDYYLTFHTNAIGNMGTHYLLKGKFLWDGSLLDGEYIMEKAMCVPNKKEI